jgi:outer membrane biosynthesis protein TonB
MTQFLVGTEAALTELLERTERIETNLSTALTIMATFETAVEALVDYAKALKAENALLAANDEADAAAITAANAKVAETEAALAATQTELAEDTAEEERLLPLIASVLPTDEEPMPEPEPEPMPEPEPTPEPEPMPEPTPEEPVA